MQVRSAQTHIVRRRDEKPSRDPRQQRRDALLRSGGGAPIRDASSRMAMHEDREPALRDRAAGDNDQPRNGPGSAERPLAEIEHAVRFSAIRACGQFGGSRHFSRGNKGADVLDAQQLAQPVRRQRPQIGGRIKVGVGTSPDQSQRGGAAGSASASAGLGMSKAASPSNRPRTQPLLRSEPRLTAGLADPVPVTSSRGEPDGVHRLLP